MIPNHFSIATVAFFLLISVTSGLTIPATNLHDLSLDSGHTFPITFNAHPENFRLTIAAAVRSVQVQYPHAQLNRIEATSISGPLHNPRGLTDLRLFFADPSSLFSPAILLKSKPHATAWGQWDAPQVLREYRPRKELELGDILTSDIVEVVVTMVRAGQLAPFVAVDVVKEQGMTEAWWQFQMSGRGQGWVWVGDESGRVEVERHGTRERVALQ
ncbi:MAG: hypothetical protein Q9213_008025 [Squamulea squamosa]